MQTTTTKLYDWQVFQNIAPYLNFNELIKTSTLSKQYNYTLRNYIKKHLLPKESLTAVQNQNQFAVLKKILNRKLNVYNHPQSDVIIPNLILKDVQVGKIFTLLQTIHGKKFLMQNNQLFNKKFEVKTFTELQPKFTGKFVVLIGDHLYIANDNKLRKIKVSDEQKIVLQDDGEIVFQTQITHVKVSLTHLYVVTTSVFNENRLYAVYLNEFKNVQIMYEQEGKQSKHFQISNLSVGANTAYYINNFKVYQFDLQNHKEPKLMKSLKDKLIRKIINGSKHFFAIEKGNKLTQQWETKDLIQWANKEGYEDYVKIFKSQKVTGKTLLNMDKRYMEDVLGILNVKIQQRLMVQLEQCNHQKQQTCGIFAWGRNDKGQLGFNPSNPVSNPHKLLLPQGFSFLKCSNSLTFIHNKKSGKVMVSSAFEGKFQWKQIFDKLLNIWSVSTFKDTLIILSSVQKGYVTQQLSQAPVYHKKQKLRTAKNIIDKIQWDQNIDKKQFRVGYLDKFTGILEISFKQLLQSTEIKDYRIEYFKRSGEIVWSKKDRIDIL